MSSRSRIRGRVLVVGLLLFSLTPRLRGADPIRYEVRLDAPQTQMVDVAIIVPGVRTPELELALPVWRPGRYTVLDPSGTVQEVRAATAAGAPLVVRKVDKSRWRVTTGGAETVRVEYRIYANSIADRTRHVDDSHAFLSGSAVFMYAPGRRGEPVEVAIDAPAGWRVATGLVMRGDLDAGGAGGAGGAGRTGIVIAPSYDVLVDSPLEIGRHDVIAFTAGGAPHEIVLWPPGVARDETRLVDDFRAIIETQKSIFGRLPYERYVFLVHVGAGGGGTEHLNSTIMQTSRAAIEGSRENDKAYRRFLGLVAHEFFHTWNVKQFRPAGIHPYDYQRENYTPLLWVAEGTTSYYDDLSLVRAGLMKPKRYLERLGEAIDALRRRPGAGVQSLEASSFDAWVKFTKRTPHSVNSTVSFYSKGALVSLLLDLEIRRASGGEASLDDVMVALFDAFPLDGPGYTTADLQRIAEHHAGVPMAPLFERFVAGTEPLPFEELLHVVGLELVLEPTKRGDEDDEDDDADDDGAGADVDVDVDVEDPGADDDTPPGTRAEIGLELTDDGGRARVRAVRADGPAFGAGVIANDEIIALDGRRVTAAALDERLRLYEPGAVVTMHVMRRDELRAIDITLAGRPDASWRVRKIELPTDAQKSAWSHWTAQPW